MALRQTASRIAISFGLFGALPCAAHAQSNIVVPAGTTSPRIITGNLNDTITTAGVIRSTAGESVRMNGGNDTLNVDVRAIFHGSIDGGAGFDRVVLQGTGSGVLTSTLNFEKLDVTSGNWSLTGVQRYTGGISIEEGASARAAAIVLDGSVAYNNIVNSGTLILDQADPRFLLTTTISGSGALVKRGGGSLLLTPKTYTGATIVEDGTLMVSGAGSRTPLMSRAYIVAAGATLTASDLVTVALNTSGAADMPFIITNSGTISNTRGGAGTAIEVTGSGMARTVVIRNNLGGVISSQGGGAINIASDFPGGSVVVENAGTIETRSGRAILGYYPGTGSTTVIINNLSSGEIRSALGMAVMLDRGSTVNNNGLIFSEAHFYTVADIRSYSGQSGVHFIRGGTANNLFGGVINGWLSGVDGQEDVSVINEAGATILGRNGPGIADDVNGNDPNLTSSVVNRGTIRGSWDGGTHNGGNGDGIAFRLNGVITNFGTIQGERAGGDDGFGRPNSSQGISLGGGTIANHAGATIIGEAQGVLASVVTNADGAAFAATTIDNAGTVRGDKAEGILFRGDFADTITNSGAIIGGSGTALNMGGGDDTLNILTGATFLGKIDGGAGADRIVLGGNGNGSFSDVVRFERLEIGSGDWSFTAGGPIQVNAGSDTRSVVTIGNGGTLSGNGSIASTTIQAGGTIAPGTSTATLTIKDNFVQAAGSTYAAEVSPTTADLLLVGGTATIQSGATLAITRGAGVYEIGTRYTLLTAGEGVTGAYTSVTQNAGGGTDFRITQTSQGVFADVVRSRLALQQLARNSNQAAVASGLDLGSGLYDTLTSTRDETVVATALDQLSGEIHASARTAMVRDASTVQQTVASRINYFGEGRSGLWGQFMRGGGEDRAGRDGGRNTERNLWGVILGGDVVRGPVRFGLAGGYTRDRLAPRSLDSVARVGSYNLIAYAGAGSGALRFRAGLGYSWVNLKSSRTIAFAGFVDTAMAKYTGETLHGFAEVGAAVPANGGVIEPFVGIAAYSIKTDAFSEDGGPSALSGASRRDSYVESRLGVRVETPVVDRILARARMAWVHLFDSSRASAATMRFHGTSAAFDVTGTSLSKDAANLSLELIARPNDYVHISASYDGSLGGHGSESIGRISLSVAF